jgi:hypothetical protein
VVVGRGAVHVGDALLAGAGQDQLLKKPDAFRRRANPN